MYSNWAGVGVWLGGLLGMQIKYRKRKKDPGGRGSENRTEMGETEMPCCDLLRTCNVHKKI